MKDELKFENINQELIFKIREAGRYLHPRPGDKNRQKEILVLLEKTGSIPQRELTRELKITPPSVSELLSKLEYAGLIVRKPSPKDRRNMVIELTDLGEKVAREYAFEAGSKEDELFKVLNPEEKDQLLFLLDELIGYWQTILEPEQKHPKRKPPIPPRHHPPHEGGPEEVRPPHGFGPFGFGPGFGRPPFPFPFGGPKGEHPDFEPPEPGEFEPERMNEMFEAFRNMFAHGFPGKPPRPEDWDSEEPPKPEPDDIPEEPDLEEVDLESEEETENEE